jgi:hypothetical protein|eukprot:COSAG06_NODE_1003_length_11130_cov_5.230804_12_plen_102_part_00
MWKWEWVTTITTAGDSNSNSNSNASGSGSGSNGAKVRQPPVPPVLMPLSCVVLVEMIEPPLCFGAHKQSRSNATTRQHKQSFAVSVFAFQVYCTFETLCQD